MAEIGIGHNPDFNADRQAGSGSYHLTQKDCERCSSAAAYITLVLDRSNLTVETGVQVTCVTFDGDRAVSVEHDQNRQDPRGSRPLGRHD